MNNKVGIIVVLILLLGIGIYFIKSTQNQNVKPPIIQKKNNQASFRRPLEKTVVSSDSRVQFSYPEDWHLIETTTPEGERGEFGVIIQSWVISTYTLDEGQINIPGDSAKIVIEIQSKVGELSIEKLVDCSMKTITCEKIDIGGEQFIQSVATLNNGMRNIVVGTIYGDKILRASALVQSGGMQESYSKTTEEIFYSIKFLP